MIAKRRKKDGLRRQHENNEDISVAMKMSDSVAIQCYKAWKSL